MRYERLQDIVRLAIRLQGALGGLTLDDIQAQFRVSRSTAERMRNAVGAAFGPLESVDIDDNRSHWRLRSDALRRLVSVSAGELTELGSAATALERAGLDERAAMLRNLATKLRATRRGESLARIESDVETLVHAEGLATRPGPKQRLDAGLLALLREAITTSRIVEFRYFAQSTGRRSRQCVQPFGLLYGNRAFLVGRTDWSDEPRLWRLANMSEVRLVALDAEGLGQCAEERVPMRPERLGHRLPERLEHARRRRVHRVWVIALERLLACFQQLTESCLHRPLIPQSDAGSSRHHTIRARNPAARSTRTA